MATIATFRQQMLDVVEERHCKRHPLTEAWVRGELSRDQIGRWAVEHWHYTHDLHRLIGRILANCEEQEGRYMEIDNLADEQNEADPHNRQLMDFIDACGLDGPSLVRQPPLPTTQGMRDWLLLLCDRRSWQEAAAGFHIGMEAQLAPICDRLVPVLRDHYGFEERSIRFFVTHQTADVEHGGRALNVVEKYTPEDRREQVLQAVRDGTEMRWLYFDGVYIKWVMGYDLGGRANNGFS